MRKALFILLVLPLQLWAAPDTLLLFNPTTRNIETFSNVLEKVANLDMEKDYHLLGVYHVDQRYDFTRAELFLDADPEWSARVSLHPCSSLDADVLRGLFKSSVGAIFPGGPDIQPELYGEEMSILSNVTDPVRHQLEVFALFQLLGSSKVEDFQEYLTENPNYMILGICLGMQTMNVATGGTLIQDIPTEIYGQTTREAVIRSKEKSHRNYNFDDPSDTINLTSYVLHPIKIPSGSTLPDLSVNREPWVLSSHHQAVEVIGKGLLVNATSMDGKIIESFRHQKYAGVMGVQFHPERQSIYETTSPSFQSPLESYLVHDKVKEYSSLKFHKKFWKMVGKMVEVSRKK